MSRSRENNFTDGPILGPLIQFALPVLFALILQAMYGAVDLLVVGQFALSADVSAVASGSSIMATVTGCIASFSMGTTILLGRQIGEGKGKDGGKTIGSSISLFFAIGCIVTVLLVSFAPQVALLMHAPEEAFEKTASYVRICGAGALVIIAYNLIGSIFRGMGDSRTPLISVAIACAVNIFGDLFFVAVLHMGAAGAACATVFAQAVSVVLSLILIRRQTLPFSVSLKDLHPEKSIIGKVCSLGIPIALQELLVGMSFMIIQAIVNSLGLIPSAGVGVAEKVCAFIMLIPSAFMQSLAAFVSQNMGAGKPDRAIKTLKTAIILSVISGLAMFYVNFFHGTFMCGLFSSDVEVIAAGSQYLKAYAIDCLLTSFLFCFIGFYNGVGFTRFVMVQGLIGAFGVRVPVSFFMSRQVPVSLFKIGLATPSSSFVQIAICIGFMLVVKKNLLSGSVLRQEEGFD